MNRKTFCAIILLLILTNNAWGDVRYTILDLGTPTAGTSTIADCVNNNGQVVVSSSDNNNLFPLLAYRTRPNQPLNPATDYLGTLGGTSSVSITINDGGQVAGYSYISSGSQIYHAFRTQPNMPINPATDDLGTLGTEISCSVAEGIDNSGRVVGWAVTSSGDLHAFRTQPNMPINPATDDLGTLGGGYSQACSINDNGQVVGESTISPSDNTVVHAYRTAANQPINPLTDDLSTLGGTQSWAYSINSSGQVVGEARISGEARHAYRTAANQPINPLTDDLGTLGGSESIANSINDNGQVVGASYIPNSLTYHAFVFDGNGPMQDLNSLIDPVSGWTLTWANSINDLGQIVGNGTINGKEHAFLLTPISVPEPSTIALLGMCGIGLIAYYWQRRKAHRIEV